MLHQVRCHRDTHCTAAAACPTPVWMHHKPLHFTRPSELYDPWHHTKHPGSLAVYIVCHIESMPVHMPSSNRYLAVDLPSDGDGLSCCKRVLLFPCCIWQHAVAGGYGHFHAIGGLVSLGNGDLLQVYMFWDFGYYLDISGSSINTRTTAQSLCMPLPSNGGSDATVKFVAVPVQAGTNAPSGAVTTIGTMVLSQSTSSGSGNVCLFAPPSATVAADVKVLAMSIFKAYATSSTTPSTTVTYTTCGAGSCSAFSSTPWAAEHVGDVALL